MVVGRWALQAWPVLDAHLLADGTHSFQRSGPLIPAGDACKGRPLIHHDCDGSGVSPDLQLR